MKRSIKLALTVFTAFLLTLFLVSPASADTVSFDGDHACPTLYPIKTMVIDVRANTTTTVCLTQYEWDIQMVGGETHAKWLASGGTYDATQDISNWKAERVAIEKLRTDTEALAKSVAEANPNTQVCKAYSYTSTYNGSGGGSFCTIYVATVDVSVQAPTSNAVTFGAASFGAVSPVAEVSPANKVTANYFASTTKATKKLKKMSYTFAKGPKGSNVSVTKTAGEACFVTGRTVYLGKGTQCSVSVTVANKGVVQGVKTYTFVR